MHCQLNNLLINGGSGGPAGAVKAKLRGFGVYKPIEHFFYSCGYYDLSSMVLKNRFTVGGWYLRVFLKSINSLKEY